MPRARAQLARGASHAPASSCTAPVAAAPSLQPPPRSISIDDHLVAARRQGRADASSGGDRDRRARSSGRPRRRRSGGSLRRRASGSSRRVVTGVVTGVVVAVVVRRGRRGRAGARRASCPWSWRWSVSSRSCRCVVEVVGVVAVVVEAVVVVAVVVGVDVVTSCPTVIVIVEPCCSVPPTGILRQHEPLLGRVGDVLVDHRDGEPVLGQELRGGHGSRPGSRSAPSRASGRSRPSGSRPSRRRPGCPRSGVCEITSPIAAAFATVFFTTHEVLRP